MNPLEQGFLGAGVGVLYATAGYFKNMRYEDFSRSKFAATIILGFSIGLILGLFRKVERYEIQSLLWELGSLTVGIEYVLKGVWRFLRLGEAYAFITARIKMFLDSFRS